MAVSVTCLFSVENESRNKNQIFGVNIEIPGVSGYKRDFSVWTLSKVLVLKHSIHSTLYSSLLVFSPFSLDCRVPVYRWSHPGISVSCIIVSPWKFKKNPTKQNRLNHQGLLSLAVLNFMGIPGLEWWASWVSATEQILCSTCWTLVSQCQMCSQAFLFFTLNKNLEVTQ